MFSFTTTEHVWFLKKMKENIVRERSGIKCYSPNLKLPLFSQITYVSFLSEKLKPVQFKIFFFTSYILNIIEMI